MINNPQKYRNAIAEGKIYVTLKQYEIFVLIAERYVGLSFIFLKLYRHFGFAHTFESYSMLTGHEESLPISALMNNKFDILIKDIKDLVWFMFPIDYHIIVLQLHGL